jgi:hypothetical protein
MSNYDAQAFREAADQCEGLDEEPMQRLLLAAAEQRAQLDRALTHEAALCADRAAMNEQIATLTAERDAAIHHVHLLTQKLYDLGGSCFPVPE